MNRCTTYAIWCIFYLATPERFGPLPVRLT